MDVENQINLALDNEEGIDIKISHTPACSIYVSLNIAMETIKTHRTEAIELKALMDAKNDLDSAKVGEQIKVMDLCLENTANFIQTLGQAIKELETKPKSRIILPPNFKR